MLATQYYSYKENASAVDHDDFDDWSHLFLSHFCSSLSMDCVEEAATQPQDDDDVAPSASTAARHEVDCLTPRKEERHDHNALPMELANLALPSCNDHDDLRYVELGLPTTTANQSVDQCSTTHTDIPYLPLLGTTRDTETGVVRLAPRQDRREDFC